MRRRNEFWIQGRSFPPLQEQAHYHNITKIPKTITNKIKNPKINVFYELPWMLYEKTKMESKEGKSGAYHSMAQPNNIKGRGKWSSLIANTKPC